MIWIGGLVLAVALYLVGPDRFFVGLLDFFAGIESAFHAFLYFLGSQAFNVVRAAAIAIFVVFLVLAFMAGRRGLRSGWALVVVPVLFLVLVWRPDGAMPVSISRWFGALLLAIIGAIVMTQRLLGPSLAPRPPPRGPWPPQSGNPV
jgi:hypothetical protein